MIMNVLIIILEILVNRYQKYPLDIAESCRRWEI